MDVLPIAQSVAAFHHESPLHHLYYCSIPHIVATTHYDVSYS